MQNRNKKLKIALTGGYASGKTTVLQIFAKHGFDTFSADKIYADLLENQEFVKSVSQVVGVSPKIENNRLVIDRKAISDLVFSNKLALQRLNDFTHKAIYDRIVELFENSKNSKIIFEIPLLFEDSKENEFDEIIVVMRSKDNRAKYGAIRDGISPEDAEKRIINQINYDKIPKLEHTLIYNDGDLIALELEVCKIIEKLEKKLS